ncbi:MAG: RNA polymerase sigma factor [bacterium]
MNSFSDSRILIQRILGGDTQAFQAIIQDYQRLVSQIIFRMVPNKVEVEDLCQDVFMKVYQNLASFQFQAKLSTWIARIAYNTAVNYLKKKKVPLFADLSPEGRSIEAFSNEGAPADEAVVQHDLTARVEAEIQKLPVRFKTILTLYHLQEMSYAEIGKIMGLPDGTVKSYLFRARRMLRERLLAKYDQEVL